LGDLQYAGKMLFFLILSDNAFDFLEAGNEAIDRVDVVNGLVFEFIDGNTFCEAADKSMESSILQLIYIRSTFKGCESFPYLFKMG